MKVFFLGISGTLMGNLALMAKELGHENPNQFLDKSVQSVHYKNAQNEHIYSHIA